MKVRRFSSSTTIPGRREDVFPFFAAAENLERITPDELRFRIVSPLPIEMRVGTLITYRLQLFGVPFSWVTRIRAWDPPVAFEDEQLRGPYRQWIHRHRFFDRGEQTLMEDEVDYALPCYPLGEVAAPLVALQVRRIFQHRTSVIAQVFRKPQR